MGVIWEGILRGCQSLFTPVSLGYPLSVFNKNSTRKQTNKQTSQIWVSDVTFVPFFRDKKMSRVTFGTFLGRM